MAKEIKIIEKNDSRKKALESALSQLDRSFGKGAVMRMGDRPEQNIDTISTGSIGLDIALGIGGLPRGRIIEIYGPESSGKCLTDDTTVITESGLYSVKELFEINGINLNSEASVIEKNVKLLNENNIFEETSHFTINGKKETVKVKLDNGSITEITLNHPIRIKENSNSEHVWQTYNDGLRIGDSVPVRYGVTGEGYRRANDINEAQDYGIRFWEGSEQEVPLDVRQGVVSQEEFLREVFRFGISISLENNALKSLQSFLTYLGFHSVIEDGFIAISLETRRQIFDSTYVKNYYTTAYHNIVSLEKSEALTYDVCLPETHSFWSNGLISHNTTLTLQTIAEAQKLGGTAAFIDAEHALDPIYAKKLGVDVDNLLISQPDHGEQALEIAEKLITSGAIDILVVDSVAALTPLKEIEGEMGDSHMGLQARLMSQGLRKITGAVARTNTLVIFINQTRMKINAMFQNPETTTGGNALKFYSSVRMDIRRIGSIKDKDEVTGNATRVKIIKNKVAPPFRQVEFDIMFGEGVSKRGELIDLGVKLGFVEKSGAWFSYNSIRIGQGKENAKKYLAEHPEIAEDLETKIRATAETTNSILEISPIEGDELDD